MDLNNKISTGHKPDEVFTPSCISAPACISEVTGNTIKQLRNQLGMSQVEFSVKFGIPVATVRSWEQGVNKPRSSAVSLIRMIATGMGVKEV